MNGDRRRARLREIHHVAESLREDVAAPDLTEAIIRRVHEQRPFLPSTSRRVFFWCKAAVGGLLLLVVGAILTIRATTPQINDLTTPAQPIVFTPVVDSVRDSAALAAERFRVKLDSIQRLSGESWIIVSPGAPVVCGELSPVDGPFSDHSSWSIVSVDPRTNASSTLMPATIAAGTRPDTPQPLYIEYSDLSDYPPFATSTTQFAAMNGVPKPAGSPASWHFDSFAEQQRLRQPRYRFRTVIHADHHLDRHGCELLADFVPMIAGPSAGDGTLPR